MQRRLLVQYHDLESVQGAPFTIKYDDGQIYRGTLDAQGQADLKPAPEGSGRLEIGEDSRSYEAKAVEENPDYKPAWTIADMDASLAASQGGRP